jgi:hypothetical protein
MLRGRLALLALTLVVWCYRVAKLLSFVTGYGERSPNVVGSPNFVSDYVRGGSYQVLPGVVILCLVLTVTAVLSLRGAENGGAVAWRAHPRISFSELPGCWWGCSSWRSCFADSSGCGAWSCGSGPRREVILGVGSSLGSAWPVHLHDHVTGAANLVQTRRLGVARRMYSTPTPVRTMIAG